MSDNRSKSILAQVAFKAAVDVGTPDVNTTIGFYEVLLQVHEKLGISLQDTAPRNSGGGGGRKPAPSSEPKQLPEGTTIFTFNGEQWLDFRAAKAKGTVKERHPEFKSFDWKQSVFMKDQDGNPNPDAAPYVTAADQAPII